MRSSGILFGRNILNLMCGCIDFCQLRSQCFWVSTDMRAHIVGCVFARAADRHLHQHGGQGRQNNDRHPCDHACGAAVLAVAAAKNIPKFTSMESAPAMVAVTVMMSVSRFLMWASSWEMTPAPSSGESSSSSPVVAATALCCGLRPVANAFGCGLSII